jgi:protein arginine kinase activator
MLYCFAEAPLIEKVDAQRPQARGKVPQSVRQIHDFVERVKSLQKRLEKAISEEDFEQAASCRDEINQLKQKHSDLPTS